MHPSNTIDTDCGLIAINDTTQKSTRLFLSSGPSTSSISMSSVPVSTTPTLSTAVGSAGKGSPTTSVHLTSVHFSEVKCPADKSTPDTKTPPLQHCGPSLSQSKVSLLLFQNPINRGNFSLIFVYPKHLTVNRGRL